MVNIVVTKFCRFHLFDQSIKWLPGSEKSIPLTCGRNVSLVPSGDAVFKQISIAPHNSQLFANDQFQEGRQVDIEDDDDGLYANVKVKVCYKSVYF